MWRVWWPSLEMNLHGYVSDYCTYGEAHRFEVPLRSGRYNTVVTPRMAFPVVEAEKEWLTFLDSLSPRPTWWYDLDDDLISPTIVQRMLLNKWPDQAEGRRQLELQRQSRLSLLRKVDGVTVASAVLAEVVRDYFPGMPIKLVPNGINPYGFMQLENQPPTREIPPLTVGWSGGPRLEADLEPLPEVWRQVAQLRPDVHFVVQGWLPSTLASVVPANRLHFIGGVKNEDYPSVLHNIDIFCCIASDDPWLLSKSPIKWFEATLAGAACVVSKQLYGPVIDPPCSALVASSVDEWVKSLLAMVDDAQLRNTIHTTARATVLGKHTIQATYGTWIEAWATLQ